MGTPKRRDTLILAKEMSFFNAPKSRATKLFFFQRGDFNFAFRETKLKEEVTNDCNISKLGTLNYLINEYSFLGCNVELLALVKARSSTLQSNKRVLVY